MKSGEYDALELEGGKIARVDITTCDEISASGNTSKIPRLLGTVNKHVKNPNIGSRPFFFFFFVGERREMRRAP